jgi:hypothetical protein
VSVSAKTCCSSNQACVIVCVSANVQGEFQPKPESIFQEKTEQDRRSLFLCFLYQDHADFGALFIALYE